MKKKHILKSKTAILNIVVAVLGVIATIDPTLATTLIGLIPNKEVGQHVGSIVVAVVALTNIYLRVGTKQPLKLR